MDEKEAEARPVMGTIFLVIELSRVSLWDAALKRRGWNLFITKKKIYSVVASLIPPVTTHSRGISEAIWRERRR